ncbi:MAG: TIGR02757 family protein [Rikenellaceae bacterium]
MERLSSRDIELDRLSREDLHALLEDLHDRFNRSEFVEADPISVPHRYESRDDREVAGFFASTIAWGNRKAIVKSAHRMMECMGDAPADFVRNASEEDLRGLESYVHRTFNGLDFRDFVMCLRGIYERWGGIGNLFECSYEECGSMAESLSKFRGEFFMPTHQPRCEKHLSSIDKGAACKRTNMFVRWMVRRDNRGVDFGEWTKIPMSALYIPLDVHSGNMARALGLLSRKQSDWRAVAELTANLREFDVNDPVKYDFALFGAGIDGFLK